jgi:hypothetical protein
MFGQNFGCSTCDFEWLSGWSHHIGGQFLLCRSCCTPLLAGGGKSNWSPKPGEQLELFYGLKESWHPSGMFITVPATGVPANAFQFSVLVQQGIPCPTCHATSAVTDSLKAGEPCPKCKRGFVEERGTCIF